MTTQQPSIDRFPWLKLVYDSVKKGETNKALRIIYAAVEEHFKTADLVGLGEILSFVDVGRLNPQTATALLRISGRAKDAIPAWHILLKRARTELARQDVPNLPALLVGRLLDDGFGNVWEKCEPYDQCALEIVRPGKVQCERCQFKDENSSSNSAKR